MNRSICLISALLASTLAAETRAQELGDVVAGRAFAEQVCAACHAVGKGPATSPNAAAPSFERVADTPGMTALALTAFLNTSHRTMPNLVLPEKERTDVIAYILSLKATR